MDWLRNAFTMALVLAFAGLGMSVSAASLPQMMNNERMLQVIKRLETDADKFSNSLDKALDRTRLDGSLREDDINALVDAFEYETDQLRERVEDNEAVAGDVEAVLVRGLRLEMFMQRHKLDGSAPSDWMMVRKGLDELAKMFNVTWVWTIKDNTAMKNLPVLRAIRRIESQTDEFQNSLSPSLDTSALNGTPLEDEINALAQNLEKEADGLRDRANNRPGGGIAPADVEALLKRALLVEAFMQQHGGKLNTRTRRDWAQVKTNLDVLADAYNVAWVWTVKVVPVMTTGSVR